jgi:hypothetical protein
VYDADTGERWDNAAAFAAEHGVRRSAVYDVLWSGKRIQGHRLTRRKP